MVGKVHNDEAEIRLILGLKRQGCTNAEIAEKCNEQFKHRKRTSASVKYVVDKYKSDPA